jgi:biopolymer transport protein ExbD
MVSTTFVDESRIELQLPQASAEPAAEQRKDPIEVAVTASGEYRVNGQTLINTSPATLSAAVSKVAGDSRETPITLRADARATHQSVVTAMDVLGRLGFRSISIATVNEQQEADSAD